MENIELNDRSKQIDFQGISQKAANPKARVRAIVLNAVKKGKNKTEIVDAIGVHRVTVATIIKRVNECGEKGLYDRPRSGRPPAISSDQEKLFLERFKQAQEEKAGGRLTGYDAQRIMGEIGVHLKLSRVYDILHKLELVWITSRSIHPKANQEAQDSFKKTFHKK